MHVGTLSYDQMVPSNTNLESIIEEKPSNSRDDRFFNAIDYGVIHVCLNCDLSSCILDKRRSCHIINEARRNYATMKE